MMLDLGFLTLSDIAFFFAGMAAGTLFMMRAR